MLSEDIKFVIKFWLVASLIVAAVFSILYAASAKKCKDTAILMQVDSSFGFYTGCLIKIDNKYVPLVNVRIVEVTK